MNTDELRQEIEQTRQRLGETVDELAAKADMKARARAKAAEAKARAQDKVAGAKARAQDKVAEVSGQVRQSQVVWRYWPVAVAAGVLAAGAVAIWQWRKQR